MLVSDAMCRYISQDIATGYFDFHKSISIYRLDLIIYSVIKLVNIHSHSQRQEKSPHTYKTAMHSISTSVLRGKVLTATQLSHHPPKKLDIAPVLRIHRIHIRKVVHIIQKHIDLDHLVDRSTSCFEDVG
ncbi:hypothetical protein TMatcc_009819 [Talaromyces marneffei ATCC 18224]